MRRGLLSLLVESLNSMNCRISWLLFICLIVLESVPIVSQTPCLHEGVLSERVANYVMSVKLDHEDKQVSGSQRITWHNPSPDTVRDLRFYMYLNAFKNNKTSFLRGLNSRLFGQDITKRVEEEWGWIEIQEINQGQQGLGDHMSFVQDLDGNTDDETVLIVALKEPVLPYDSVVVQMRFTAKLPRTVVRSGFSNNDFFHVVHWYPKLGVYEQNREGTWSWNCHQFLPQMEFYGDFGHYDVSLNVSDHLVMGASGCMISEHRIEPGRVERRFIAADVIDYAWTLYPRFEEYRDTVGHIALHLLIPPEHRMYVTRILSAAKSAFTFLEKHVGKYPYNHLTIIDPPFHALNSGFMEYPQLITGGSIFGLPQGWHGVESLIIHELTHQYFMGILANNEKEEPWLDEGFVSYYENRITDALYGADRSFVDILGIRVGNTDKSRIEYTGQENLHSDAVSTPSWKIKGSYKNTVYSKAATVLLSLSRYMGVEAFDAMMQDYYQQYMFKHPRKDDFYRVVRSHTTELNCLICPEIDLFLERAIDGTDVCDYAVTRISHEIEQSPMGIFGYGKWRNFIGAKEIVTEPIIVSSIRLERKGSFIAPVDVVLYWEDGSQERFIWDGIRTIEDFVYRDKRKIISAYIDPEHVLALDKDYINNSYTLYPNKKALWKYADKMAYWVQSIFQASSFLM